MGFKRTPYGVFRTLYAFSDTKGGTPATSRHTSHTLRLLPSGPDRVHELLLREDQSPIILFERSCLNRWGDYSVSALIMQEQKP